MCSKFRMQDFLELPIRVDAHFFDPITETDNHSLSQQGVWVYFLSPKPLKSTPQDTQNILWRISSNVNIKHIIEFCHLHIIPMTLYKDIMPYFDKFNHVYGWNMSIVWSPLNFWTPQNFTIANFRHPVSKSWLRPCWKYFFNFQVIV